MSIPVLIDLVVGEALPDAAAPVPPITPVSLAQADAIAAVAQAAGVTAIRLVDGVPGVRTIDPTVVGAYLAGRYGGLGYLADVPTSHNPPYNVARRIASFDRATAGWVGVVLRPGGGDEVSDATVPDPAASDAAGRWAEYAGVLTDLFESYPRAALLGDVERALVVDETLIRPIEHEGRFYRVRGPLDGPVSEHGRPVLAAADLDVLGWPVAATRADVVVVDRDAAAGADVALTGAAEQAGRLRADLALVGRATADGWSAADLRAWAADSRLDALELVPAGGAEEILALLRDVVPTLWPVRRETLRSSLGLRPLTAVPA